MTQDLARRQQPGRLATEGPTSTIDSFRFLDVYAGGLSDEAPRVEALATISAGFRAKGDGNRPGNPQRSKDGTIYLHDATGRAPGLARALEATAGKRLTIAFPFDDPAQFIHCRFMRYSASELLAFGDETHLMVLVPGQGYQRIEAGTDAYKAEVALCKVSVSVYFCLAEWAREGPEIVFPDGVGAYYRLRFTSRHSLRSIITGLRAIGQFTGGRIAGVPFDLAIDFREVAGSDGKKRTIPVWWIATKPAGGMRLSSGNFSAVMTMALDQGAALMLPAPTPPTLEDALLDGPAEDLDETVVEGVVVEPTDRELALVARGGRCNADFWNRMWHAAVRGSDLEADGGRAAFVWRYTRGGHHQTDSLSEFLHWATEKEAQALVLTANEHIAERIASGQTQPKTTTAPSKGRRYEELFPDDEAPQKPATGLQTSPEVHAAAVLTGAPVAAPETPKTPREIVEHAADHPETFTRFRADDWYEVLAAIAVERQHPMAGRINAKQATELDYVPLMKALSLMLSYFPDVTLAELDVHQEALSDAF